MRSAIIALALSFAFAPLSAQVGTPPHGLVALELERSHSCVAILARVDVLDAILDPLIARVRRLGALAQALALEDQAIIASLDGQDTVEAQLRDWFAADGALAQSYIVEQDPAIAAERAAARDVIKKVLADAIGEPQAQADVIIRNNRGVAELLGPCDGAIFVRGAVLEACETAAGPICEEAAADPSQASRFRFVDSPESVWEIQELRPWTNATPLQPDPTGQLGGAQTVGYARVGNVVVTVGFTPLLRDRAETPPEDLRSFQATNDALGITFAHPDLAFAPALSIRAALPNPLADETRYVLHFGDVDDPDVVWSGEAGTGETLEDTVPLEFAHVTRLRAGEPITLTAMKGSADGVDEPAFTIEFTNLNQATATEALLGYMARQLSIDLSRLVRPRGD